jgi:hypothetical protein
MSSYRMRIQAKTNLIRKLFDVSEVIKVNRLRYYPDIRCVYARIFVLVDNEEKDDFDARRLNAVSLITTSV